MRCPSCGNENREGARFCDSCGSELSAQPPAAEPRPEQLPSDVPSEIAGRYRVRRFLGQGGRKRVYLSDDTATGTEVLLYPAVTVVDPGFTYKLLVTGLVDANTSVDGEFPVIRVRQGSTTGPVVASGAGLAQTYTGGVLTELVEPPEGH